MRFVVDTIGELWTGAQLQVKNIHACLFNVHEEEKEDGRSQMPHIDERTWRIAWKVILADSDRILVAFITEKYSKTILNEKPY